jgi:hypothetical protein
VTAVVATAAYDPIVAGTPVTTRLKVLREVDVDDRPGVQDGLEQATWEQKRQLIEWLVVRVIVINGAVEIRYAIPTCPAGEAARFCHLHSDYRAALGQAEGVASRGNPRR